MNQKSKFFIFFLSYIAQLGVVLTLLVSRKYPFTQFEGFKSVNLYMRKLGKLSKSNQFHTIKFKIFD
jgi:hypothetical protein